MTSTDPSMQSRDPYDMNVNISFLMDIIKANKLHEPACVAFSLPKDHSGMFGFSASMMDNSCHCWLDADNRAEEGKGFAFYHLATKELGTIGYVNRHGAVKGLLKTHPDLSPNKGDENYWLKTYAIVEVTVQTPKED